MTKTTILAYRTDYIDSPNAASEWYCPTCFGELEPPEIGTDHLRDTPITDASELPDDDPDGLPKQCDAGCGRYLFCGQAAFEMSEEFAR